jgi:hypothetical protein
MAAFFCRYSAMHVYKLKMRFIMILSSKNPWEELMAPSFVHMFQSIYLHVYNFLLR